MRLFRRGIQPNDTDIDVELEHHLATRVRENIAAGMSPDAARQEALQRLGDVDRYRRDTRAIDERMSRGRRRVERFDVALRSVRYAIRLLARRPGFSLIAVVTLALGLGASAAIYTLVDDIVLRPLAYDEPERLVTIEHPVPGLASDAVWGVSYAGYFHFLDHNRSFEDIGLISVGRVNLSGDGQPERVPAAWVTASVLRLLRASTVAGRLFTVEEDEPPGAPVAVLSRAFWVRRYGGDPSIVGRTIELGGRAVEVVGVLAPGFELPHSKVDLWMPQGLDRTRPAENSHIYRAIGRLRPDVTPALAQADLSRLVEQFTSAFPRAYSAAFMRDTRFDVAVEPLRESVVGDASRVLWMLFGSVALVLVIASANVANLFLVRAESRRRESAIRSALGAGRRDLAWGYLAEGVTLGLLAAAIGLLLAGVALRLVIVLAPTNIPRLDQVSVGASSILFTIVLAVLAGVVFGLIPLLRAGGPALLREGGRGGTASRTSHAMRGALVVTQVALALVLLAGAGLMVRSFRNLLAVDPGIDPTGVITFELTLPRRYESHEAVNAFYRDLTQNLERLPGVARASATTWLPAAGQGGCDAVFFEDRALAETDHLPCAVTGKTTPGFVESLGMRVRGRTPTWSENNGTGSAVVTRAFADRFWPGEDPLGKGVRVFGPGEPYYRVVGVADGVRANLDGAPVEALYLPILPLEGAPLWAPSRAATIVVRTRRDELARYVPPIKRVVAELDPTVPIANVQTMDDVVAGTLARRSFTLMLLGVAATMALVLSAVGLYGVIAYIVGQRTPEIGIRMALGARTGQLRTMVVRQALVLAGGGIAIGLLAALVTTRALHSLLFEVSPTDPLVLGAVSALLVAIALAASWAPARRATRVDPLDSLRAD